MKKKEAGLLAAARKRAEMLKLVEFECPSCGGVASAWSYGGAMTAECHACGLYASERIGAWKPK